MVEAASAPTPLPALNMSFLSPPSLEREGGGSVSEARGGEGCGRQPRLCRQVEHFFSSSSLLFSSIELSDATIYEP